MVAEWDWSDPRAADESVEQIMEDLATFASVEPLHGHGSSRDELASLGVNGIEFATFKTLHPSGMSSDIVSARSAISATKPGQIYLIDGRWKFVEADVTKPLPFDDATFEWVYAEHLLEHLSLRDAIVWLSEVRRILRPGGVLRLSTPDLELYMRGYLAGNFFEERRRTVDENLPLPAMPARRAFMVNQIFAFYGHQWVYDYDEVAFALGEAGFDATDIKRVAFNQGARADVAALDQAHRSDESMYVEGVREPH
ncbi:class I SAM-dependent methyltransferase [Microbacterium oleivorans]|uniref:Methyltransferase domain-containing protein n=1 Tax=Microbacterium oleivorans TaxID=273677 RepID=A0A7D5IRE2_9MICO|nr:methyltransferase domain-containing protein [Microbacterium oleivorans]QLD10454.1 methyltransferase domain-containing protein [Microbacterium oleivorans]